MDQRLINARRLYGSVYISVLPDNTRIPWKLLSLGDYFEYDTLIIERRLPLCVIEDEIFKKCVVDQSLVHNISQLKAGDVSTVATAIRLYSGPQTVDELNEGLEIHRHIASQLQHKLVTTICSVFTSYKPEDIYAMDYSTILLRLAQAERFLLESGSISEPICFTSPQENKETPSVPISPKRLKEMHEFAKEEKTIIPASQGVNTIITDSDVVEHTMAYTGHEMEDRILLEHEMVKNTAPVYADYLQQMKNGEKVVIKTVEERMKEARVREAENKKKYFERVKNNSNNILESKQPDKIRRARRTRKQFVKKPSK